MVWLVKDGCGIACVVVAWLLMAFSQYALLTIVLLPQPDTYKKYLHIIIFELFSILALVAHFRSIFTDPGSVPRKTATPELIQKINSESPSNQVVYKCSECCSVKPDRAHHCSVCKRCIRKMDHHCPWVNNCVGERNQKFFVLFTFYITIISFHALVLAVGHFIVCLEADWSTQNLTCPMMNRGGRPSPENLIMLVFLTFEALLFSLFCTIMFSIQLKSIWTDWTGIENLKKENRNRRSGCKSLRSVFGEQCICWLSPFTKTPSRKEDSAIDQAMSSSFNCPV